jgi:O-methyltransferase involved in polyketide biosynthesis
MAHKKPSATALFVTHGVWWISQHPQLKSYLTPHLEASNKELMSALYPKMFFIIKPVLLLKTTLMQKLSITGFYLHFALRKRLIEEEANAMIRKGTQQVVILGAGFDTLSLTLSRQAPNVAIFEVDQEATQILKQSLLRQTKDYNIHFLPLDFNVESLLYHLKTHPYYDMQKKIFFYN